MRFMAFVKADEKSEAGVLPDEKTLSAMGKFNEEMIKAGVMLGGDGLQATSKGSLVRRTGTKVTVVDGPFAEAKELVAGFWIMQTKSKTEAVQWLERAPFAEGDVVELRELYEAADFPQDASEKPDGWRAEEERMREAPPPARKAGTTRYMVMVRGSKATESGVLPNQKVLAEMGVLMEEVMTSGAGLSGEGLKPTSKGARIRYGKNRTVVDGPFTESKELIAGYVMLQTKTKAEAIDFAKRWLAIHVDGLGLEGGAIEVRQLFELEDFPVSPDEKAGGWRDQEAARARA